MKLGIHHPSAFSDRWISYCKKNNINYKVVNALNNDIINQLQDCDALMWHHSHGNYRHKLAAKSILFALEHAGIPVFPDFNTGWHFDDKVAQKYLLEAIDAPLVPSYVFYDKQKAKDWVNKTTFPKVFKLTGGAGAANVNLAQSKRHALKLVNKAFGRGFPQFDRWGYLKERYRKFKTGQDDFIGILKGLGRLVIPKKFAKMQGREKGYVYFQEFVPKNDYDIRIIVIGNRAFGLKRMVREGDFRASGSGTLIYDKEQINIDCIGIAFKVNRKIQSQSIAFDFIFDANNTPKIVEISYGFSVEAYDNCPGYWDQDLNWHEGKFNPQEWMIEDLLNSLYKNNVNTLC